MGPESLSALVVAIYRRRVTVFLVLFGALGGGWWFTHAIPPIYQARAVFFVPEKLPLLSLESAARNLPTGPLLPDSSEETRVGVLGLLNASSVYQRMMERIPDTTVAALRKAVVVDLDPTQQILVYAQDPSAERAAELANEYVRAFQGILREMDERAPRATLAVLREEEPRAWQAFQDAQDALVLYLDTIKSVNPELDLQQLVNEREKLRDALRDLDLDEGRLRAQRPLLEARLADRPEFRLARQTLVDNPGFRSALDKVGQLRADLAVARLKYKDIHPEVVDLLERLHAAEEQVKEEAARGMQPGSLEFQPDEEARTLLSKLVDADLSTAGIEPSRAVLRARLQEVQDALGGMPLSQAELDRLETAQNLARQHAELVSQRVAELQLQLQRGIDFTYVDQRMLARPEDARQLPSLAGVMIFAGLGGLAAGLALAISLELLAQMRLRRPF